MILLGCWEKFHNILTRRGRRTKMNKQTKLEQAIEILTANNQQEIIKIINKLD